MIADSLVLKISLSEHTVSLKLYTKCSVYLFWLQNKAEMEMKKKGEWFLCSRKIWSQYFNFEEKFKRKITTGHQNDKIRCRKYTLTFKNDKKCILKVCSVCAPIKIFSLLTKFNLLWKFGSWNDFFYGLRLYTGRLVVKDP